MRRERARRLVGVGCVRLACLAWRASSRTDALRCRQAAVCGFTCTTMAATQGLLSVRLHLHHTGGNTGACWRPFYAASDASHSTTSAAAAAALSVAQGRNHCWRTECQLTFCCWGPVPRWHEHLAAAVSGAGAVGAVVECRTVELPLLYHSELMCRVRAAEHSAPRRRTPPHRTAPHNTAQRGHSTAQRLP